MKIWDKVFKNDLNKIRGIQLVKKIKVMWSVFKGCIGQIWNKFWYYR